MKDAESASDPKVHLQLMYDTENKRVCQDESDHQSERLVKKAMVRYPEVHQDVNEEERHFACCGLFRDSSRGACNAIIDEKTGVALDVELVKAAEEEELKYIARCAAVCCTC